MMPASSDRASMEAHQLAKLRPLLAALLDSNPFYSAKLGDLDRDVSSLTEFSRRVPFTFKQELVADQNGHPPYGSNLTFPLERYSRFNQTSGTTGHPLRWLDTGESWEWMLDCWTRVYQAAGVGEEDRVFFPFSFGPFLGFWVAFEAAARIGCLSIPGGGMRSSARIQTILDNQVTVLCSTPTYAIRMAEVAAEEGFDLSASRVRRIIVAGEPGGGIPATRALIERLWPGARVADHHGMTEIGPVSYECPARQGVLHVIEAAYFAEVIDPVSLEAVGPGGTGELVLTNLGRIGSPLLRYRTRDVVRRAVAARCDCGSWELALEGGILGRSDDMVVVRGVNLYPSAVEEIIRSCHGVGEFRVEVDGHRTLSELSFEIEPQSETVDPRELAHQVESALRKAFSLRVSVSPVPCGTLPRFEAKARRWIRR
ncbi:MAG: phenylacetate--CoA ligase family protein [Bryobacteraceae bacterium]